jgi:hypothetical protein
MTSPRAETIEEIRRAVAFLLTAAERDRSTACEGLYLTLRVLDAIEAQGPVKARERRLS